MIDRKWAFPGQLKSGVATPLQQKKAKGLVHCIQLGAAYQIATNWQWLTKGGCCETEVLQKMQQREKAAAVHGAGQALGIPKICNFHKVANCTPRELVMYSNVTRPFAFFFCFVLFCFFAEGCGYARLEAMFCGFCAK